ncbi:MAG: DedA family protein [Rouxiella aceris]|uniref:DedA family protein n=1 Tax=Rouxiella aceris TaxID=2703884 RepID=UPI00284F8628|nr:DedA family protein [Rouxiella aceris]MDR3434582.1 DedA family protein [Rouxiella aceris]
MAVLTQILHALWQHDFSVLANPNVLWVVYAVLFTTLFLENGLLPASFLPGDSLLLLTGALVAKGVMSMLPTLLILVVASSLGCWLSYLQGRWLGHSRLVKGWLLQLPAHYHQRAHTLFTQHGLTALLIGRFLAFVRTLLPTIAGISGLDNARFQLFNWLSAVLWVGVIMGMGFALCHIPIVKRHEDQVMAGLMVLPALLLVTGLAGALLVVWRNKRKIAL